MVKRGIGGWVSGIMALVMGLAAMSGAAKPKPRARQIPEDALRLAGRWDITVHTSRGEAYSWLEIEPSGATLVGRFVGRVGSARPLSKVEFAQGTFHFTMPRQYEGSDLQFEGKWEADRLTGTVTGYDRTPSAWTAKRAPALKRERPPQWGKPLALFNGSSLEGWKAQGRESRWTVKEGVLTNTKSGANLVTTDTFEDFKLHVEFRI